MDAAARLRVSYLVPIQLHQINRAGGNGTAGTAMAVPVFEGEKWRRFDSNLCVRYRMASPDSSL